MEYIDYYDYDEEKKEKIFLAALSSEFTENISKLINNYEGERSNDQVRESITNIREQIKDIWWIISIIWSDFFDEIYWISENWHSNFGLNSASEDYYEQESLMMFYRTRIKIILKNKSNLKNENTPIVQFGSKNEEITIIKRVDISKAWFRAKKRKWKQRKMWFLSHERDFATPYNEYDIIKCSEKNSIDIDKFFDDKNFSTNIPFEIRKFMELNEYTSGVCSYSQTWIIKFLYKYYRKQLREKVLNFLNDNNINSTGDLLNFIKINPRVSFLWDISFFSLIKWISLERNDGLDENTNYNSSLLNNFSSYLGKQYIKRGQKAKIEDFFNDKQNLFAMRTWTLVSWIWENGNFDAQIKTLIDLNKINSIFDLFIFYEAQRASAQGNGDAPANSLFILSESIASFNYFITLWAWTDINSRHPNRSKINNFASNMGIKNLKDSITEFLINQNISNIDEFRVFIAKADIEMVVHTRTIKWNDYTLTLKNIISYLSDCRQNTNLQTMLSKFELEMYS